MLFSFYNLDDPEKAFLREKLLVSHREYLSRFSEQIAFAGPLFKEDNETIAGSLLVLDFPTMKCAQDFINGEPYTAAGLYASREIRVFKNRWPQKTGFPV